MEHKLAAYLIQTGTRLASDGIRIAVSQSLRQKARERLESPIPPEVVEQTDHDHTPIPEEMVTPQTTLEAKVGTACLDCISDHLDTINGALSEAVRFARSGDMAEVRKRIRIARAEVNIGERIDLDPALLPGLSREQRDIAHWVLPRFKEMRHSFQGLESAEGIENASAKVAVLTDEFATKLQGCPRCREAKKIEKPARINEPCQEPECAEMTKLWNKVKA